MPTIKIDPRSRTPAQPDESGVWRRISETQPLDRDRSWVTFSPEMDEAVVSTVLNVLSTYGLAGGGEFCPDCGSVMRRSGSCLTCHDCGYNQGCV